MPKMTVRIVRLSLLVAWFLAFTASLSAQVPAEVWRDEHGVPHIKSTSEVAAFRALGYEEARDGLLNVQTNVKRFRGQAARYLGSGGQGRPPFFGANMFTDAIVQLYSLYLGDRLGWTRPADPLAPPSTSNLAALAKLRTLFRRDSRNPSLPLDRVNQVYRNLKAYAEGLETYRQRLHAAVGLNSQELEFKTWLDSTGLAWVHEDPIDVFDVASYGAWNLGIQYFSLALHADPSKSTATPPPGVGLQASEEDEEDPGPTPPIKPLPYVPVIGSNGFGWSFNAINGNPFNDPPQACVMADPQGGGQNSASQGELPDGPDYQDFSATKWFAHIQVNQEGGFENIDAFGYLDHATGFFANFFTKDIAIGGSLAAGNTSDAFLLRLQTTTNGNGETILSTPLMFYDAYDYYPSEWVPFTTKTVTIEYLKDEFPNTSPMYGTHSIEMLSAGAYGVVVKTTPFLADSSLNWNLSSNSFDTNPAPSIIPAGRIPVLVAIRTPLDPDVNPIYAPGAVLSEGCHQMRAANGVYEMLHAKTVHDVRDQQLKHQVNANVSYVVVDKAGRLFATVAATVPQRGDDVALCALGIHEEKFNVYDKAGDPVPARYVEDKVFDWVGMPASISYLRQDLTGPGGTPDSTYMPFVLFDPSAQGEQPSRMLPVPNPDGDNPNPHYENPGFITASNDFPFLFYQKAAQIVPAPPPVGCSEFDSPNNVLLNAEQDAGTLYHAHAFPKPPAALQKNRHIIDTLVRSSALGQPVGTETPLSSDQELIDFGWDNRNPVAKDYGGFHSDIIAGGPSGGPTPLVGQQNYPVRIRGLVELDTYMTEVLAEADRERLFFRDLWQALFVGEYSAPATYAFDPSQTTDLKAAWVLGTSGHPLFWFPPVSGVPGAKSTIDMPVGGTLIDFHWRQTRIGSRSIAMDGHTMTPAEQSQFHALVDKLKDWKKGDGTSDPEFRDSRDSAAAALALEFKLGFAAATNGLTNGSTLCSGTTVDRFAEGRMWTPLVGINGVVRAFADPTRFPCLGSYPGEVALTLTATGALPGTVDADGLIGGYHLLRVVQGYDNMIGMAGQDLARSVWADSIMSDTTGAIVGVPVPPYEALYYVDPSDGLLKVKPPSLLTKADVNALVQFFLVELGGFSLTEGPSNSTTNKKGAYEAWLASMAADSLKSKSPYSAHYPLTRNLVRVTVMRRLLEADQFMTTNGVGTLGDILRSKFFSYDGVQRWPVTGDPDFADGRPCEGGSLRAVSVVPSRSSFVGFQTRLEVVGGSHHPMLVSFPHSSGTMKSFFGIYGGNRTTAFSSPHFADMMEPWVNRELVPTHFLDYAVQPKSADLVAFPVNPYTSP